MTQPGTIEDAAQKPAGTAPAGASASHASPTGPTAAGALPDIPDCTLSALHAPGPVGVLYRGRQIQHAREIAVKVLDGTLASNREYLEWFHKGAQDAAAISHPNLVMVHGEGEHQGKHYMLTEFLPGGSLEDLVKKDGATGVARREAIRIASFAAAGLAKIHERGLVHGAVKPSNILLGREGQVKVSDLGMPQRADDGAGSGAGAGAFLSPEQLQGDAESRASDIYSLGASLYYALCAKVPASGTVSPPRVEDARPGLPQDLCALLASMLAREPAARPTDTTELARRLAVMLVAAEAPKSAVQRVPKKASLRMKIWLIAAGILATTAIVLYALDRIAKRQAARSAQAIAAEELKASAAQRELDLLLAREKALGPLNASNLDSYDQLADEFGAIAAVHSIDDPAVAICWARRREILRSVRTVKSDDEGCQLLVERWIGGLIDQSNEGEPDAPAEQRDLPAIISTRESEVVAAEALIEDGEFHKGLERMAAWVVVERSLWRIRNAKKENAALAGSAEPERIAIQQGMDWLRANSLKIAMTLRADLDVDGEILRTHLSETTCFGGPHAKDRTPDFDAPRARIAKLLSLVTTGPGRDRLFRRRETVDRQSAALGIVRAVAPLEPDWKKPDPWADAVLRSVRASFGKLASERKRGALLIVVEMGDAAAAAELRDQASLPEDADGNRVRTECDALAGWEKIGRAKDPAWRKDAAAKWAVQYASADLSMTLAATPGKPSAVDSHPGIPAVESLRYLEGWGRDHGTPPR